jgi:hypothetical protein
MANEFVARNGIISKGDLTVSGSISTTSPVNLSGFATGSVLFTSGSEGAITGSANLFWDNTNGRLGIGLNNPSASLQVAGTGTPLGPDTNGSNPFVGLRVGKPGFGVHLDIGTQPNNSPVFAWVQSRNPLNYSQNLLLALQPNGGNVVIGTTTDAGFKLDVNGQVRSQGSITVINNGRYIFGASAGLYATTDNGLSSNSGAGNLFLGYYAAGDTAYTGTTVTLGRLSNVSLSATSGLQEMVRVTGNFAPTSGTALFNTLQLNHTINQTGGANGITRGLYINPTLTSAADFRAIETVTGNNLLNSTSGNTSIGLSTNTGTSRLQVRGSGATSATTALRVENTNASASLVILDNGFVGIGTGSAQYNLDLYGSYHQYQTQGELARYEISTANANQNRGIWSFYTNAAVAPDFFGRFGFKFEGGTADSFKQFQIHVADQTTPKFVVDGSGRVGIGTITPIKKLQLDVSTSDDGFVLNKSGSANNIFRVTMDGTVDRGEMFLFNGANPIMAIRQSSNFSYINTGNNFGIGTSLPSASLHISGSSSAALLRVDSPASSSILFVSGSGNVGIRTNTPLYPLDVSGSARFKFTPSGADLFTIEGASTTRYFIVENGNGFVGIGSGYTTSTIPTTPIDIRGNTSIRGGSSTIGNAFTITNSTPITLFTVQNNGQVSFTSPTIALATTQSAFTISQSISASNVVGGQYYGVNITPTFFATTSSQTETALRVAATFTGSAAAIGGQNIIADFGATSAGSQFTVTDVTSGSIYMVNDVSGLPIIEATSDWTVNMYNFPNLIFQKTGSQVNINGTLRVSGSFILPLSQSTTPQTGSAYWSGSFLFVYDGTQYRSSSFA